jgi:hypothetical protein
MQSFVKSVCFIQTKIILRSKGLTISHKKPSIFWLTLPSKLSISMRRGNVKTLPGEGLSQQEPQASDKSSDESPGNSNIESAQKE